MKLLVCGGRDFSDADLMDRALRLLDRTKGPIRTLIHGDARGADKLAAAWARNTGLDEYGSVIAFPAEWSRHGKGAGPIRNQRMLDVGQPDIVAAFPGGSGTADMVRRARLAGIPVVEFGKPETAKAVRDFTRVCREQGLDLDYGREEK